MNGLPQQHRDLIEEFISGHDIQRAVAIYVRNGTAIEDQSLRQNTPDFEKSHCRFHRAPPLLKNKSVKSGFDPLFGNNTLETGGCIGDLLPQQNRDLVKDFISGDDIQRAVAVYVRNRQRSKSKSRRKVLRTLKGPIAVSIEHGHC